MKKSMHAKRMDRHHRRLKGQSKLNLVSLMDIFTILVFFLLINSSDVEVLQSNKDIELPQSTADKKPENNLVIMVTDEDIIVGGRKVVSLSMAESSKTEIKLLAEELKYLASRKPYRTPEEAKKGRNVTIMGDKELPYTLLKKLMTTCAKSEYRNISLAVNQVPNNSEPQEMQALPEEG